MASTVVTHTPAVLNYLEEKGRHAGILSWVLSTDHKRIGLLYMYTMFAFFGVGVLMGLILRLELLTPGPTIPGFTANMYNAVFTLHGVIMIFLFVIPGLPAIFGNFCMPIMIGARDVAFPRLNLLSWYCFIVGAGIAVLALFTGQGFPDTGWTFYVPYSLRTGTNVTLGMLGAFIIGWSSILTGLNFLVTIHRMRAPGMGWFQMPLFVWALYATAWIQVIATPVVGITLALVMLERAIDVGIFNPALGGDPILFQHMFWIYSHPAVYIMILPAMGAISEIIPTFAGRTIFGYKAIALSSLSIASVGYLVWAHHMFTTPMSLAALFVFSLLTFFVAIPSGVKVFNWVATLYKGSIDLRSPLLFALSFIFLFSIGGLTGLANGALGPNLHIHDTYFIVGHFHYVMFGGTGFGLFAALHYWFPKMYGRMYNERLAWYYWALMFVGFNMLYFSMLILGMEGNPRRYYDYLPRFQTWHVVSTVGSWILVAGLLMMAYNFIRSARRGAPAPANPWGGVTLEWTVPSPPPVENFHEIPRWEGSAYHGFEKLQRRRSEAQ
ncbi:cbb3-type cytochrome c oxidase subunit I [bacterium]|nr:cbb3-type cytochrome c oxidase subunit I [bacterium]